MSENLIIAGPTPEAKQLTVKLWKAKEPWGKIAKEVTLKWPSSLQKRFDVSNRKSLIIYLKEYVAHWE